LSLGRSRGAGEETSEADGELLIERLLSDDWQRIAALTEQYADQPLGAVDASLVAVAERLCLCLSVLRTRTSIFVAGPADMR